MAPFGSTTFVVCWLRQVVRHSEATLLDPNWLTTAVYRVLTHSEVVKDGGEFARDNIGRLLAELNSADKYPSKWWPYIADMMVRFNLSFEHSNQPGRYLVPLQLPTQEPEVNWDEANSLRFRYDYDNLPLGLVPRFIVEMHRHLTPKRTAWVSGVVLDVDECRVLVRADRKNRRVLVFVSGPEAQRRGALTVVRTAFAKIHDLHGDLTSKPMVPVDVLGNPDAAVEYEMLLQNERHGIKVVVVVGSTPCSVEKLFEGVEGIVREHRAESAPRPPSRASPLAEPPATKPWWSSLVGPGTAAAVTTGIAAMLLYEADRRMTALLALGAMVFAVIYIVQMRMAWRSANWPKNLRGD